MPRAHGRTSTSIWDDPHFIGLPELQQRMYLFLISQPDLSHAGLIPMRVRRWASKGPGSTPKTVRDTLNALDKEAFIVVDHDTEEVLIRTFVRNDGVYKQPKVMLRLREDAKQITSPRLRAAFRVELDRLPVDELSSNPSGSKGDGPSTRAQVEEVVEALRTDFEDAGEYPPERVSGRVSDTPRVRAGAFPLPPTPVPRPPSPNHQPPATSSLPADAGSDFEAFWDAYGKKVARPDAERAWAKAIKKATPDRIIAAAEEQNVWHHQPGNDPKFIPHASKWLNSERWNDERSSRPAAPVNKAEQRMRANLAVVEQLRAEEQQTQLRAIESQR